MAAARLTRNRKGDIFNSTLRTLHGSEEFWEKAVPRGLRLRSNFFGLVRAFNSDTAEKAFQRELQAYANKARLIATPFFIATALFVGFLYDSAHQGQEGRTAKAVFFCLVACLIISGLLELRAYYIYKDIFSKETEQSENARKSGESWVDDACTELQHMNSTDKDDPYEEWVDELFPSETASTQGVSTQRRTTDLPSRQRASKAKQDGKCKRSHLPRVLTSAPETSFSGISATTAFVVFSGDRFVRREAGIFDLTETAHVLLAIIVIALQTCLGTLVGHPYNILDEVITMFFYQSFMFNVPSNTLIMGICCVFSFYFNNWPPAAGPVTGLFDQKERVTKFTTLKIPSFLENLQVADVSMNCTVRHIPGYDVGLLCDTSEVSHLTNWATSFDARLRSLAFLVIVVVLFTAISIRRDYAIRRVYSLTRVLEEKVSNAAELFETRWKVDYRETIYNTRSDKKKKRNAKEQHRSAGNEVGYPGNMETRPRPRRQDRSDDACISYDRECRGGRLDCDDRQHSSWTWNDVASDQTNDCFVAFERPSPFRPIDVRVSEPVRVKSRSITREPWTFHQGAPERQRQDSIFEDLVVPDDANVSQRNVTNSRRNVPERRSAQEVSVEAELRRGIKRALENGALQDDLIELGSDSESPRKIARLENDDR